MTPSPNFYQLLQVDRHASKEVIEAAYRSLAKKFHPDVNKSPDAAIMMQQLNLAYSTLSDDDKRAEYDRQLNGEGPRLRTKASHAEEPKKEEPRARAHEEPPQPIACENCGRVDDTLRAAFFQYVISIVVLSFKRGGGGILCSGCRTDKAIRYTLASVLFGPWGLPWGIFWTIGAVLRNLSGGKQPPEVNGPLLRSMGAYFLSVGDKLKAISALEASLQFEERSDVREALQHLKGSSGAPNSRGGSVHKRSDFTNRVALAVIVLVVGVLLSWLIMSAGSQSNIPVQYTSNSSSNYSTPAPTATMVASPTVLASESAATELVDPIYGWRVVAGQSYMQSNVFHVDPRKEGYSFWYPCNNCPVPADFTYTAVLSKVDGPDDKAYGLEFRVKDEKNFYTFQISSNGVYSFSKLVNNEWQDIIRWTRSQEIRRGNTTNTLRVSAIGGIFQFYINDKYVDQANDDTFSSGTIGIGVGTGTLHISLNSAQVRASGQAASVLPTSTAVLPSLTPTGSNTVERTATPTSMWLLADDFVDNANWWPNTAKMYLENGLYHVKETDEGYSRWAYCLRCDEFTDFAYEAMISKVEGPDDNGYGISFRKNSAGDYVLWISGDGGWKFESYTSQWNAITQWAHSDAINRGNSKNKIRVVARGSAFEFYVNDSFLGSAVDSSFSSGNVGFGVGKVGLHIVVQYVRVWNPNRTALAPPTSSLTGFSTSTRFPRDIQSHALSQGEVQTVKDAMDLLMGCSPAMFNYIHSHVDTVTRGNKVADASAYVDSSARMIYLPQDGSINDPNHYTDSMRTFVAAVVLVH